MILLSVSRIGKEKNIDELIGYMKHLTDKKISMVLVGDGPAKENLEKLTEKLGLSDIVKFTGMIAPETVPLYYQMADLFVSASTSEAQGLTYIEALATSTPLLCRKDDCLEGVLQEGLNGYSYINEAEFLHNLELLTKSEKEIMALCAKRTAARFTKDVFVQSIADLYHEYTGLEV